MSREIAFPVQITCMTAEEPFGACPTSAASATPSRETRHVRHENPLCLYELTRPAILGPQHKLPKRALQSKTGSAPSHRQACSGGFSISSEFERSRWSYCS